MQRVLLQLKVKWRRLMIFWHLMSNRVVAIVRFNRRFNPILRKFYRKEVRQNNKMKKMIMQRNWIKLENFNTNKLHQAQQSMKLTSL